MTDTFHQAAQATAERIARDTAEALDVITGVADGLAAGAAELDMKADRQLMRLAAQTEALRNAAEVYHARQRAAQAGIVTLAIRLHATHAHVHGPYVSWLNCGNELCEESRRMHRQSLETMEPPRADAQTIVADIVASLLGREGETLTPAVALERANQIACWVLQRERDLREVTP